MTQRFRSFALFAFLTAALLDTPSSTAQEQAPLVDFQTRFIPAMAQNGMVAGPERLASEAGLAMLKLGGNAVDAAVATGFALAVTLPRAGNLAGGGFMLIHLAEEDRQIFIDYRESAPAAARRDMFLKPDGSVNQQMAYFSHKAAAVPGTVAGLLHALEQYGSLDLATVIQPAIDLAEQGFAMDPALNMTLNARAERLGRNPETKRIYLPNNGKALNIGDLFKQPDLAATLTRIREGGRDGFYRGKTAELITQDMAANDGLITLEDLDAYQPKERTPVRGTFRDFEIVSAPPPSSGGVALIQMLNLLEPIAIEDMGHNSGSYIHHLIEVMRLAYADRSLHLGDPDQSAVPTDVLISKEYADRRRGLVSRERARSSEDIGAGTIPPEESPDTTHFSVADGRGNVVSNTYTLNFSFGSHIVVPGTGMLLNNEMDDFAARPGFANAYGLVQGEANAINPQRRPLSSMTPTLVFRDGQPWLATGSPGGSRIITAVTQTILNATVFDMNVAEATALPRIHHQWLPDAVRIEEGVSPDTIGILETMGHETNVSRSTLGRVTSIMLENGWLYGYADLRRPGAHVAGF